MDRHGQHTEADELDGETPRDGSEYNTTTPSRLLYEEHEGDDDGDDDYDDDDGMRENPMDSDGEVYDDISDATDYESDEEYSEENAELNHRIEEFNNVYEQPPEVNAAGKLMCKLCPNVFVNNQTLFNHFSRTHADRVEGHEDEEECDQDRNDVGGDDDGDPNSPVNIQSMAANADLNDNGQYLCHLCPSKLANQKTLINHWRRMHTDHFPSDDVQPTAKYRNYKCPLCAKAYRFPGALATHYKKNHPDQPQPALIEMGPSSEKLPCQLCSKTFANTSTLANHYHSYHPYHQRTDEFKDVGYEFKCDICDAPFRQKNLLDKHKEKNFCHRVWVEDPYPPSWDVEDTFACSEEGPTDSDMANKTAVELFMHFFQPVMIKHWIPNTNANGRPIFENVKYGKWKDVTFSCACRWLALYLAWGLSETKTVRDPWKQKGFCNNKFFTGQMPGYRFNQILRASRFNNNTVDWMPGNKGDVKSNNYDREYKVTEMMQTFFVICENSWSAGRCLSLDESMVKFTGSWNWVQSIPRKPISSDSKQLFEHKQRITIIAWLDSKIVLVTHSIPNLGNRQIIVKRRQRYGQRWVETMLTCPEVIVLYNQNMGGIDLADQIISQNRHHFKQHLFTMQAQSETPQSEGEDGTNLLATAGLSNRFGVLLPRFTPQQHLFESLPPIQIGLPPTAPSFLPSMPSRPMTSPTAPFIANSYLEAGTGMQQQTLLDSSISRSQTSPVGHLGNSEFHQRAVDFQQRTIGRNCQPTSWHAAVAGDEHEPMDWETVEESPQAGLPILPTTTVNRKRQRDEMFDKMSKSPVQDVEEEEGNEEIPPVHKREVAVDGLVDSPTKAGSSVHVVKKTTMTARGVKGKKWGQDEEGTPNPVSVIDEELVQEFVNQTGCPVFACDNRLSAEDTAQIMLVPSGVDPDKSTIFCLPSLMMDQEEKVEDDICAVTPSKADDVNVNSSDLVTPCPPIVKSSSLEKLKEKPTEVVSSPPKQPASQLNSVSPLAESLSKQVNIVTPPDKIKKPDVTTPSPVRRRIERRQFHSLFGKYPWGHSRARGNGMVFHSPGRSVGTVDTNKNKRKKKKSRKPQVDQCARAEVEEGRLAACSSSETDGGPIPLKKKC